MISIIEHEGVKYPAFQASHNSARFIIPVAIEVCKGIGYDIGAGNNEWKLPGSIAIDPMIDERFNAMNLPDIATVDYIFSSHCLEHLPAWVEVLDYWTERLSVGGVMFLYLPDFSQSYWRAWFNYKHKNIFTPEIIRQYFIDKKRYTNIFASGIDLNNSFAVMAEKMR